ncbi:MAG: DUF6489 family protein [Alphaproteobacteria bacterium]|jgi:hypothetical protein
MKIKIDIDCTPQEARAFLGLPDVAPLQEALLADMQSCMQEAVAGADLESLLKTWMPAGVQDGLQGWESAQKAFRARAAGAAGQGTSED